MLIFQGIFCVLFFFKQMPCVKKTTIYNVFWNKLLYIHQILTNIPVKYMLFEQKNVNYIQIV